jgi:hypothetical protein
MDDKHHPGRFDKQMFRKGGLKGTLIVVVEVVVVVTTVNDHG